MEKIITDPQCGDIKITKSSRNHSIRISVSIKKGIRITMPFLLPYSSAIDFFNQKREWVICTIERLQKKYSEGKEKGIIISMPSDNTMMESLRKRAKSELTARIKELAILNGFTDSGGKILINKIAIKNNVSNWGSCSGRNNINLNMRLLLIPEHLQDFVLLHELCHLIHKNHGGDFHKLLNTICLGREQALRHELRQYKLE